MVETILIVIVGLIGGVAVGLQSPLAGAIGQRLGGTASSFIVHLSGMILSGILLVVRGGENIKDWNKLPWYMLGAGIFGVILYQTISVTLPRLGSTMMVTLIIVGQLLVGVLIDQFGWLGVTAHPINATRVVGVLVLLAGAYLIAR
jgi:bacterial/archaeal transporter family-2 protein